MHQQQTSNVMVLKSVRDITRLKIPRELSYKLQNNNKSQIDEILQMFANKRAFSVNRSPKNNDKHKCKTQVSEPEQMQLLKFKRYNERSFFKKQKINGVQKIVQQDSQDFTLLGIKSKSLNFQNHLLLKESSIRKKQRKLTIQTSKQQIQQKLRYTNTIKNLRANAANFLRKIQKNSSKKIMQDKMRRFAIKLNPIYSKNTQNIQQQECMCYPSYKETINVEPMPALRKIKQKIIDIPVQQKKISKGSIQGSSLKYKQIKLRKSENQDNNRNSWISPWAVQNQQIAYN